MLAQNFKTADELGLAEVELEALSKVLGMLEREEIAPEAFDMEQPWPSYGCDTPVCIIGWCRRIDNRAFHLPIAWNRQDGLSRLFNTGLAMDATPSQGATALRSYLTTGEPQWAEAMADTS